MTEHKFFCSAPLCDIFLVLARILDRGLSRFIIPLWRPDGTHNTLLLQRFKYKLGNRSNASMEIEFDKTYGTMIGKEGRGIKEFFESHGDPGLVEKSMMQRHYREARLNSIWGGSGDVVCVDILGVISREPIALSVF